MNARRDLAPEKAELLRQIPSVDELLQQPQIAGLATRVNRVLLVEVVRAALAGVRARILEEHPIRVTPLHAEELERAIAEEVERLLARPLRPVINATGVVLHTNLGRAPLAESVAEEIRRTATQYNNLEYDLEAGARGKRDTHTSEMIERLTGAEAAIVVNNCAAAILLVLAALAKGGEVIVSRGELIEIGDGFRVPEIMAESGAVLREVGTTNRTRIEDYRKAMGEKTRALLQVHPSNFKLEGFTEKPEIADLVALSRETGLPLVQDLGSGCVAELGANGISEPTVRESVEAGISLVVFSGDKLLGGPQAGIIAGKKELVQKVRRHPLFRALRVDKLTIAALEVTLSAYLRGAVDEIPSLRMIRTSKEEMAQRTREFVRELRGLIAADAAELEIAEGASLAGGGSTPTQGMPSAVLRVKSAKYSSSQLEKRLRMAIKGIPVIARIEEDRVVLDLRTVFAEQEATLAETLAAALC